MDAEEIKQLQEKIALYEDMNAYKRLYKLFFHPLHRFATTIVHSRESAEEIVSDVFVKLWQIRARLTEIQHLKVYLFTVTRNFSINHLHADTRRPRIAFDIDALDVRLTTPGPEELCVSADLHAKIQQAIDQLPARCKLIFHLVKENGLAYKEVAQILSLSVLTVRNQVALAVTKLSKIVPNFLEKETAAPANFSKS